MQLAYDPFPHNPFAIIKIYAHFCLGLLVQSPTSVLIRTFQSMLFKLYFRLLISEDGSFYCARYRDNLEQLQGEANSYLLAKVLNFSYVPTPFLLEVCVKFLNAIEGSV